MTPFVFVNCLFHDLFCYKFKSYQRNHQGTEEKEPPKRYRIFKHKYADNDCSNCAYASPTA